MPEPAFALAALPVFDEGLIECLEWSFDMGWGSTGRPAWVDALLDEYSTAGWLLGHGVSYSLLGAHGNHQRWLRRLANEVDERSYRWITEHVGFVGAGRFTFSAPMPMPMTRDVVALGVQRLRDIATIVDCPVGVENLATCLSTQDAVEQGRLVRDLLSPVDGILLLDLHNLWCQSLNCDVDIETLLTALPLDRVREIHLAGGRESSTASGRSLRRDTHDQLVPPTLLELLERVAPRCPNLEAVIYERLGTSLTDVAAHNAYRADLRTVSQVVAGLPAPDPAPVMTSPEATLESSDGGLNPMPPSGRAMDQMAQYQANLLDCLDRGRSHHEIEGELRNAAPQLAPDHMDDDLVEVAAQLTRTWGVLA
ncbi:MAG: DUF692 family protein [Acidimicrobiales bacterium]|nr:DUF692 family protein [Acidimicrobiales bacterium]